MKVLALCTYPTEAAATRFRLDQYVESLHLAGIDVTVSPFLDNQLFKALYSGGGTARKIIGLMAAVLKRITILLSREKYDLILVQREAMLFGPPLFEWLFHRVRRLPMVLDLDDATYVRYVSPRYGRVGSFFKFFGKTDYLIKRSSRVVCGNRFIAAYVESKGARATIVPTVVGTKLFSPVEKTNEIPVIGWIGTHSTFPFLLSIFPVLERLAESHAFKLRIVGGGRLPVGNTKFEIDDLEWSLDREIDDFKSLDIGLYPIVLSESANEQWLLGKSGFKAIQYMAVGVPFVMSPVGVCAEMGVHGVTHFNAETDDEWFEALETLIASKSRRLEMGAKARNFSLENYTIDQQVPKLIAVLEEAARKS